MSRVKYALGALLGAALAFTYVEAQSPTTIGPKGFVDFQLSGLRTDGTPASYGSVEVYVTAATVDLAAPGAVFPTVLKSAAFSGANSVGLLPLLVNKASGAYKVWVRVADTTVPPAFSAFASVPVTLDTTIGQPPAPPAPPTGVSCRAQ